MHEMEYSNLLGSVVLAVGKELWHYRLRYPRTVVWINRQDASARSHQKSMHKDSLQNGTRNRSRRNWIVARDIVLTRIETTMSSDGPHDGIGIYAVARGGCCPDLHVGVIVSALGSTCQVGVKESSASWA